MYLRPDTVPSLAWLDVLFPGFCGATISKCNSEPGTVPRLNRTVHALA
jgi:hypothetical protein